MSPQVIGLVLVAIAICYVCMLFLSKTAIERQFHGDVVEAAILRRLMKVGQSSVADLANEIDADPLALFAATGRLLRRGHISLSSGDSPGVFWYNVYKLR